MDAPESKGARAVRLLREAADAYDALPVPIRSAGLLGPTLNVVNMRREADTIERRLEAWKEAT